jgi:hypothetical protein
MARNELVFSANACRRRQVIRIWGLLSTDTDMRRTGELANLTKLDAKTTLIALRGSFAMLRRTLANSANCEMAKKAARKSARWHGGLPCSLKEFANRLPHYFCETIPTPMQKGRGAGGRLLFSRGGLLFGRRLQAQPAADDGERAFIPANNGLRLLP